MADLIKMGALWIKKDKRGRSYLTGRFTGSTRLMIFKNEYKTSDNQPDYEMYIAAIEPTEGATPAPRQSDDFLDDSAPTRPSAPPRRDAAPAASDEDDDEPEAEPVETRRPQPARTPASTPAASASRAPSKPATNGADTRGAARPARNAPPPTDDFDDMDDPFEN